jgi:opacity protein-like surface antigen
MKKIMVIVVTLSFVFIGILSAEGLGYGAKAGLNMAKFSGSDADLGSESPKFKLGMTVGGFVTYSLSDKLVIRPEILFTQKGTKYKISEDGVDGTWKFKMNWLDIPILAVYQVVDNISVIVGPYFDLYLGGEMVVESDLFNFDEKIEGEDVNSLGFGLIFGGAYGVTENIDVEARFALGLSSIDDEVTMKNTGIQVNANYYLKK